jgi:ABC-type cobalamin transport system ATPase subunit
MRTFMASEKQAIMELIKKLPEDVTLSDIMHHLYLQDKLARAESQLDAGEGISHADIEVEAEKWLE